MSVFLPRPLIVRRVATRAVLDRKPNLLVLWGLDQSRVWGCLVIICEDGPGWQRPNIPVTDNSLTTPLPSFTCCESNEIRPLAYNRHKSCPSYSPNLRLDRWISANRWREFRLRTFHFQPNVGVAGLSRYYLPPRNETATPGCSRRYPRLSGSAAPRPLPP